MYALIYMPWLAAFVLRPSSLLSTPILAGVFRRVNIKPQYFLIFHPSITKLIMLTGEKESPDKLQKMKVFLYILIVKKYEMRPVQTKTNLFRQYTSLLTVPHSTQTRKWEPGNLMLGINPAVGLPSHTGWRRNTPSRYSFLKSGYSLAWLAILLNNNNLFFSIIHPI